MANHFRLFLVLLLYHSYVKADPLNNPVNSETNQIPLVGNINHLDEPEAFEVHVSKREISENNVGGVNENVLDINAELTGEATSDHVTNSLPDSGTNNLNSTTLMGNARESSALTIMASVNNTSSSSSSSLSTTTTIPLSTSVQRTPIASVTSTLSALSATKTMAPLNTSLKSISAALDSIVLSKSTTNIPSSSVSSSVTSTAVTLSSSSVNRSVDEQLSTTNVLAINPTPSIIPHYNSTLVAYSTTSFSFSGIHDSSTATIQPSSQFSFTHDISKTLNTLSLVSTSSSILQSTTHLDLTRIVSTTEVIKPTTTDIMSIATAALNTSDTIVVISTTAETIVALSSEPPVTTDNTATNNTSTSNPTSEPEVITYPPTYTTVKPSDPTTKEHTTETVSAEPSSAPSEPTSEPSEEPLIESSTNKSTYLPTGEPTSEPSSEPTSKPKTQPTSKPVSEPTSKVITEPTSEPVSEPTSKVITESTSEPVSEPTSKVKTESSSEPTPEPSSEPTSEPKTQPTSEPTSEPINEPKTESTSEPTSEPTVEHKTEPKPESTSEPGSEAEVEDVDPTNEPDNIPPVPETEPQFNTDAFAEPGPDWPAAKLEWKEAWHFHIYFYGAIFAALGIYCFTCIFRLWNMQHLLSKNYFVFLNILVLFVCALRSVYLLVDGYNSAGTYPVIVNHLLYSTVFPCLTAMFSILFYALLLATRVRLLSTRIQKVWVLIAIIFVHFCLSISTDILIAFVGDALIMLFVCQIFFITWGLLMFIGYLIIFKRLYSGAMSRQVGLQRSVHESKRSIAHGFHDKPSKHKYTLGLAVKVTLAAAFFGMTCVAFELYGMFGVYGVLGSYKRPEPWPWWIYHLIVRTLEFCMCVCVLYVATQPLKYTYKNAGEPKCKGIWTCNMICCRNKLQTSDDTSSVGLDNYTATDVEQFGWLRKFKRVSSPDNLYPPHDAEQYKDPDATLLVRKVKTKPSMLVVEDGFVRIRREDEMHHNYPYEVESDESSNDVNAESTAASHNSDARTNISALSQPYTQHVQAHDTRHDVFDISGLPNHGFSQDESRHNYVRTENGRVFIPGDSESVPDETDVDIEITDSEHSEIDDGPHQARRNSNISEDDIFRPLSMIDLAASMESKLERAFHSSVVGDVDNVSHTSLPLSLEVHSADSRESEDSEPMMEHYLGNRRLSNGLEAPSTSFSETQSSSVSTRLLPSPVRRCNSAESKAISKSKLFGKKRYFSLCDMEQVGKLDLSADQSDFETTYFCVNTKDLVTEL